MGKGTRLARIRRVKEMRDADIPRAVICKKMGLAPATVASYIEDFSLLDEAQDVKKKPQPKARKCLHCRATFKPPTNFRFMCNTCNNFAREALI